MKSRAFQVAFWRSIFVFALSFGMILFFQNCASFDPSKRGPIKGVAAEESSDK